MNDPINRDSCVYDRTGLEDIQHARATVSGALDSGSDTLPCCRHKQSRKTGYHELGPVQIFLLLSIESLEAETGAKVKLDVLGGVLTSHRDMGLPISPDDEGKLPLCAPDE